MNQLNLSLPDWINSFLNEYPKIIPEEKTNALRPRLDRA